MFQCPFYLKYVKFVRSVYCTIWFDIVLPFIACSSRNLAICFEHAIDFIVYMRVKIIVFTRLLLGAILAYAINHVLVQRPVRWKSGVGFIRGRKSRLPVDLL